ncbi:class I SAM-dependent methyltransferase [Allonocardiopsis opalescens]|uniref:dTDP-3-amino-3,4, 6-trideoxy-alpha-D-glucopyranose N,N-dimethyltransferase/N-dimethyltransferase n=1 Tax=Allonocardiopsis opalescens TaxID=1144618 RepID=A0A2T0QCR6_9ACTN|nr:class I SAM-dependent methyltransferase [Allonocardiopsis opalescens]PRY01746.1 dTDP-3-amino-3,4,6-trideoxy-alpha-D-glucopyranose N,N-dimethyltransferase/N-dimethyltransferase [Allonocardiopsis opalescens]
MYTEQLSRVYEFIYRGRGKDWAAEADEVARLVRERYAGAAPARSLLDVACGTGAHLEVFGTLFDRVEGLEMAKPMRELARRRLPGTAVHEGDMRDFELGRRFAVVTCMFCSIAYVGALAEMRRAVAAMVRHLEPGGVLVIEPWWFPENFLDGYVACDTAREDDLTVVRMSHSVRREGATHMEVRFLVGRPEGIESFTEFEVLSLFTRDEYLAAFADAGCPAEFLPGRLSGRGLFVGVKS